MSNKLLFFFVKSTVVGFLILLSLGLSAQSFTLSGYIRDALSGEELISATVAIPEAQTGTYTNEYGFYSITLPAGTYKVTYTYSGYLNQEFEISINKDIQKTVELSLYELDVVEITDRKADANVDDVEMSSGKISIQAIKKQPVLLGEFDVIRSIQLLPGVQAVGEGITGYYVRGGGSDQNLILLDEATVYNASHLLGFFSVFNPDALKDEVKIYKGGIPAQYGGRLSSTLDLRMKEGNDRKFHATGGLGLISSRLSLEAPLKKEKGSFLISGRRTYADVFLKLSDNPQVRNNELFFYDFNAKANYRLGDNDRLYASGYFGKDVFSFQDQFGTDWGNQTATLRWNHLFNDKLFFNATAIYSDFDYGFKSDRGGGDKFLYESSISDLSLKMDFTHFAHRNIRLKYGGIVTKHTFAPGRFIPVDSSSFYNQVTLPNQYAIETGLYASNEHKFGNRFTMIYGLRYSTFSNIGPSKKYIFAEDKITIADSVVNQAGKVYNSYSGFEPRASFRYKLSDDKSIKGSYNRMFQYMHLASNTTASFPWDLWVPSSARVKPEVADQVAIGYFQNFDDNKFEGSVELYYKWLDNQFDFRENAQLVLNEDVEKEFRFGSGRAYGLEFQLTKSLGKTTGMLSYTLATSTRQIDSINGGRVFSASSDRRHDIALTLSHQLNDHWTFATSFVYYTGSPITLPAGKYVIEDQTINYYSERNGYRMPDYHRMDLSATWEAPQNKDKKWHSSWNFSLYNAYGRKNAFALVPDTSGDTPDGSLRINKVYLFRWVPSVTYNFNF